MNFLKEENNLISNKTKTDKLKIGMLFILILEPRRKCLSD